MEEQKEKKRGGWKRVLLITVCVILSLILILTACAGIFINYLLGKIERVAPEDDMTISSSEVEELLSTDPDVVPVDPSESLPSLEDVTIPPEIIEPEKQPQQPDYVKNILLVGQDRRGSKGRARSDAMILVTFNTKAKTITLTSFMRDAYVRIPGYAAHKLNHAYQYGGFSLLNETLKVNFGVEVHGNFEVDFQRFQKLIDFLGGVDITLTEEEADYLYHGYGMRWDLQVGVNHLNGEQALAYARIREIDNDYQRTNRQRKVLVSLMNAYKNQPLEQLLPMLEETLGIVTTNMDNGEIVSLALDMFPMLASSQINTMQIPAHGTFDQGNVLVRDGLKNWFQYNIDFAANRKLIWTIYEEE
jgi:LCP family protein required for cell wall assembly